MNPKITEDEWIAEVEKILGAKKRGGLYSLSDTQKRRYEMKRKGLSNREIAIKEGVTKGTVHKSLQDIRVKAEIAKRSKTSI